MVAACCAQATPAGRHRRGAARQPVRPPEPSAAAAGTRGRARRAPAPERRRPPTHPPRPRHRLAARATTQSHPRPSRRPCSSGDAAVAAQGAAGITGDGVLFPALVIGVGPVGMTRPATAAREPAPPLRLARPAARTCACCCSTPTRRWCGRRPRGRPGAAWPASDVLLAPLNRPSYYLKPRDGRPDARRLAQPAMLYRIPRSQVTTGVRRPGPAGLLRQLPHHRPPPADANWTPASTPTPCRRPPRQTRPGRAQQPAARLRRRQPGRRHRRRHVPRPGLHRPRPAAAAGLRPARRGRPAAAAARGPQPHARPDAGQRLRRPDRAEPFRLARASSSRPTTTSARRPIQDADPPFGRCFLLPLPDETDEAATRELVDLAGQYLYRDLCSPLGKAADLGRAGLAAPPWAVARPVSTRRSACTSWPGRATPCSRAAGRRLCQRLVQRWMSKDSKPLPRRRAGLGPGAVGAARTWAPSS